MSGRLCRKGVGFPGVLHQEEIDGLAESLGEAKNHLSTRPMTTFLEIDEVLPTRFRCFGELIEGEPLLLPRSVNARCHHLQWGVAEHFPDFDNFHTSRF